MEHLKDKKLVFVDTKDPIASFRRAFKYAAQGFFMDTDSIASFLKKMVPKHDAIEKSQKKWNEVSQTITINASDIYSYPPQSLIQAIQAGMSRGGRRGSF